MKAKRMSYTTHRQRATGKNRRFSDEQIERMALIAARTGWSAAGEAFGISVEEGGKL